jgi:hypothetical protein
MFLLSLVFSGLNLLVILLVLLNPLCDREDPRFAGDKLIYRS